MNSNLAQALSWHGIHDEPTAVHYFNYLHDAGYLSDNLIDKAVLYLHRHKAFDGFAHACAEELASRLKAAFANIAEPSLFFDAFPRDFSPADLVDFLMFLQQTAFDRKFGEERNQLNAKPWMNDESKRQAFLHLLSGFQLTDEQKPQADHYSAVAIMGASYPRVLSRINYFKTLPPVHSDLIYYVTGERYLSKGLDGEERILEVAADRGISNPQFLTTEQGQVICKEVTETHMVQYLIKTHCSEYLEKIDMVDSDRGAHHWRADTKQNAKDFAAMMMERIQSAEISKPADDIYRIVLVVEQPYANRMAKEVQRAFNAAAAEYNLHHPEKIEFRIEATGKGLAYSESLAEADKIRLVTQCNSDFAAYFGVTYPDAQALMAESGFTLRDPKSLMFSSRDKFFNDLNAALSAQSERNSSPSTWTSSLQNRFSILSHLDTEFPQYHDFLSALRIQITAVMDAEKTPENTPRPSLISKIMNVAPLYATFYEAATKDRSNPAGFFAENASFSEKIRERLGQYLTEEAPQLMPASLICGEDGVIAAEFHLRSNHNEISIADVLSDERSPALRAPQSEHLVTVVVAITDCAEDPEKISALQALLSEAEERFKRLGPASIQKFFISRESDKRIVAEIEKSPAGDLISKCS